MARTDICTVNGITIRRLHSPDGIKTFGYLTGVKQPNGDLSDIQDHGNNLLSAERRVAPFTVIDRVNGWEIRKMHSIDKRTVFGYAAAKDGVWFGYSSLAMARHHAGFLPTPTEKGDVRYTAPKNAYPQNQPGYDPHSAKAR